MKKLIKALKAKAARPVEIRSLTILGVEMKMLVVEEIVAWETGVRYCMIQRRTK